MPNPNPQPPPPLPTPTPSPTAIWSPGISLGIALPKIKTSSHSQRSPKTRNARSSVSQSVSQRAAATQCQSSTVPIALCHNPSPMPISCQGLCQTQDTSDAALAHSSSLAPRLFFSLSPSPTLDLVSCSTNAKKKLLFFFDISPLTSTAPVLHHCRHRRRCRCRRPSSLLNLKRRCATFLAWGFIWGSGRRATCQAKGNTFEEGPTHWHTHFAGVRESGTERTDEADGQWGYERNGKLK